MQQLTRQVTRVPKAESTSKYIKTMQTYAPVVVVCID